MDVAALVISIVALILTLVVAGFGIVLQFLMFKGSSDQTTRVGKSLSDFKVDLESMIGELKGQTSTMAGMQTEQFNTMLDAFVRRPEAVAQASKEASQSASESRDVMATLENLEARVAESRDFQGVTKELEDIRSRVKSIGDLSSSAARLADESRIGRAMFAYHVRDFDEDGRYKSFPVDVVHLLRDVSAARSAGISTGTSNRDEWYRSALEAYADRDSVLERAVSDGLLTFAVGDQASRPELVLTERGRRLLEVLKDVQP